MKVSKLPPQVRIILVLAASVLMVANQLWFSAGSRWGGYITVALTFLAGIGVHALKQDQFQELLKKLIPAAWLTSVHTTIAAAVAAGTLALTSNHWSKGVHALLAGVVALLVGLGFGPGIGLESVPAEPGAPPKDEPVPVTPKAKGA
jgi:hypothetical protein